MKSRVVRSIDARKHTIKIVRLSGRISGGCTLNLETSLRVVCKGIPYDIQYQNKKQERSDIYSAIAKWASELGVSSIGGPILSGAVLAEGIAARSRSLLPFYITKKPGLYKAFKHSNERIKGVILGRKYIVVDDIVSSGDSMESALKNIILSYGNLDGLKAVITLSGGFSITIKPHPILMKLADEGKLFCLFCLNKRRRS